MPFRIGKSQNLEQNASPAGMKANQRKGYEILNLGGITDPSAPKNAYDPLVCLSVGQRIVSLEDSRQQGASLSHFLKLALGEDFSLCPNLNSRQIRKGSSWKGSCYSHKTGSNQKEQTE